MKRFFPYILAILTFFSASATQAATPPLTSFQLSSTTPTNGFVLQTDGSGNHWVATSTLGFSGGSGAVSSVFGRTGAVVATAGDYTTAMVTEVTNLYFTAARVLATTLTGFVSGAGTVSSSDTVLSAIDKLDGNIAGKQAIGNYITALTGDVTASGPGSVAATLATVNGNVGSFTNANITVNAKGLITAASNGASGSGGAIGTSTALVNGQVDFSTSVNTIANDATFLFDSTLKKLTTTNASTTNLSISSLTGTLNAIGGNVYSTATTSVSNGTGIGFTGTPGALIGGSNLTITNTGVTSNVAGTGISVSGATGAVTIGNTGVISLGNGTGTTCSGTNPGTCNVNTTQNITTLSNLTVAGFVQTTSGGVLSSAALTSGQVTTALGFTPISGNQTITLSGVTTGSGTTAITTAFGSFTSATLAAALSDETGTGAAVFAGSPALTGTATGVNLTLSGNEILTPLATPAGAFLAVNPSGQIIATTTPSGGGAVSSVSNSDGTLTISPTTGAVVASLNLTNANTWTGQQTFNTSAPIFGTITGSTQCLHVNSAGLVSGTGSDCGSGGGGGTPGGASSTIQYNANGAFAGLSTLTTDGTVLGLGTTTPWGDFSIGGVNGSINPGFVVASATDSSTQFVVAANGEVGVGTSTPSATLSVNAASQNNPYFAIGSSTQQVLSVSPAAAAQLLIATSTNPSAYTGEINGNLHVDSSASNAFSVGMLGSTTVQAFNVDQSLGGSTGVSVQSNAAGSGIALQTTSSNVAENINILSKGTGSAILTSGTSNLSLTNTQLGLTVAAGSKYVIIAGQSAFTQSALATAATPTYLFTGVAETTLTASTEHTNFYLNMGQTDQHATGALALQRDVRITGTTHSAVGASVITTAAAFSVDGPDSAGTNATISSSTALYIPRLAITGTVTNSYGAAIFAASGATNNYAAEFMNGNVGIGTSTPTTALVTVAASTTIGTVQNGYNGLVNIIAGLENTTTVLFQEIDQWGDVITSGDAPSVSGGTSSVSGNQRNGNITVTGTALTSVTLTFAHPWPVAPDCTTSDNSLTFQSDPTSISTTQIVIGFTAAVTSANVWYICQAHQ